MLRAALLRVSRQASEEGRKDGDNENGWLMMGEGDTGGLAQLWNNGAANGVENYSVICFPSGGFDVNMG